MVRITGGKVYDPANGVEGVVKDICIDQAGHIVADLAETVRGAEVRRSPDDVTLFKSVGMAFEDLVVARAVVDAGS